MTKQLTILMVADGHGGAIYDEAMAGGFKKLGHKVVRLTWKEHFFNYPYANVYKTDGNKWKSLYYRFQNRFMIGPAVWRLNRDLLQQAAALQPDVIFIYRGTHVWPSTIAELKRGTDAKLVGYNNDDPFSPRYPLYFWRHFRRGIHLYDHIFCYREKNLRDYAKVGYKKTSLLRSYYVDGVNHPPKQPSKEYKCDVVFIGHYERDGRDEAIALLMDNGIDVKLYGTGWEKSPLAERLGKVEALYGDYNLALGSAKMALVFLSKLNNDTYTRRCFEIPASGATMVSEYTADLASLFEPGKDAVFFETHDDLLAQVKDLLADPKKLEAIGKAGRQRLLKDGHEVTDRARQVLETLGLA